MIGERPMGPGGLAEIMELRRQIVARSDTLRTITEVAGGGVNPGSPVPGQIGGGFADILQHAVQSVSASQATAADLASAYETGATHDVAQVMLARQEAGIAFEATLQIRNKLLSAYQDIMRMGV